MLLGGSGTAGVESCLSSAVNPEKKLLIVNNGAYGKRMVEIAQTYEIDFVELKCEWDRIPNLDLIKETIEKENIGTIAVVHHETTSGILNPVKKIGILAKQYRCCLIVDAISSFAGLCFDVKDYNIDFMISSSNKCIQGMAGISFVICNKKELDKIKSYKKKSFYLNLYDQYNYLEKNKQMRFTPPVQTIYALRQAIDEFLEEGAENRQKRYFDSWNVLVQGLKEIGFKLLLDEKIQSKILTSIVEPKNSNFDFNLLHDLLYDRDFTIYPGKIGNMDTFRVANLGAINSEDISNFLIVLKDSLKEMGINDLEY